MGTIDPSSTEFKTDVTQFEQTISQVSTDCDGIHGDVTTLKGYFSQIEDIWHGPGGDTYVTLRDNFNKYTDELNGLLDEMLSRMNNTCTNYKNVENANYTNLK